MFYPKMSNGDDLETGLGWSSHLDHVSIPACIQTSNLPLKMDSSMVHLLFISPALYFFLPFCLPFSWLSLPLSSTPHFASLTPARGELGREHRGSE